MISQHTTANSLRYLRLQAGLRQLDVAKALRLESTDRISRWENGSAVPHLVNLFKLAVLYKVSAHDLYSDVFTTIEQEMCQPISIKNNMVK